MKSLRYHNGRRCPVLDQFAELLALEYTPAQAAKAMGRAGSAGKDLLRRLRRHLGWQAQ